MRRRSAALLRVIGILGLLLPGLLSTAQAARRPNIILIMADDMGFSDLGCYGSEILTPNLDRLAADGLRFTQFYNTARCCPTRAALISGLYPHQAGVGHMMNDWRLPGYRGNLSKSAVTIAEALAEADYQTMMCGKWHLSYHTGPEGPKHNWPVDRGFEKFFGTITGAGSYFDPVTLTLDRQFTRPMGEFYYTDQISDYAVRYIEEAGRRDTPYFLYVAYTAPHWPLHAKPEVIESYKGKYAAGWDEIRQQRRKRMIAMGLVKSTWGLAPRDPRVPPWSEVPYKPWQQRRMEVYAAQIDIMDQGIGRIIEALRLSGQQDNTLVMFLADNGGCAEEIAAGWRGEFIPEKTRKGRPVYVGNDPNVMPGAADTYQSYGIPWANTSNTPFLLYKHWVHEGGIATPLIVHWPAVIRDGGRITQQIGHVIDIMATCLDVAGATYPKAYGRHDIIPLEGESLKPIFLGQSRKRGPLYWEHEGNRAVRYGKWKLVSVFKGPWELYDMAADRTELHNLAETRPDIVEKMAAMYDAWAERCNVIPWEERP